MRFSRHFTILCTLTSWAAAQNLTVRDWPLQSFVTEPTLQPPVVKTHQNGFTAPGHIIYGTIWGKHGYVMTQAGDLLWGAYNHFCLTPLKLFGKDVLGYWSGSYVLQTQESFGTVTIIDDSYSFLYNVTLPNYGNCTTGNESSVIDSHEVYITSRNTLLAISTCPVPWNLSTVNGPEYGWLRDNLVYEIDIVANKVLFQWRAIDHIPIERSYAPVGGLFVGSGNSSNDSWDYVHLNSVGELDGNFIVSSRNSLEALYIDRRSGNVIWRLQGEHGGNFTLDRSATFRWQHDIRAYQRSSGLALTIFDNNNNLTAPYNQSSGLVVDVDTKAMTATASKRYIPRGKIPSSNGGTVQTLDNGNVWMNFGNQPLMAEFDVVGTTVLTYQIGPTNVSTGEDGAYRSFKYEWKGYPTTKPAVVLCPASEDNVDVYVSWNGATEVKGWDVSAGMSSNSLAPVAVNVSKAGFETKVTIPRARYAQVKAIGGSREGHVDKWSEVVLIRETC